MTTSYSLFQTDLLPYIAVLPLDPTQYLRPLYYLPYLTTLHEGSAYGSWNRHLGSESL